MGFRYMKGCKWADISTMGGANSKLNCRQVYKIGMRLVEKFNLKLGKVESALGSKKFKTGWWFNNQSIVVIRMT